MSGRQVKQGRVIPIASRRRIAQAIREESAKLDAEIAAADARALRRMRNRRFAWAVAGLVLIALVCAVLVVG